MRKHLLSLLVCSAAAGLFSMAGCAKKPIPPEPIPAAAPIAMNNFVRTWAYPLDLAEGDSIKALHPRDGQLFVYTTSGRVFTMSSDSGQLKWTAQIRTTDRGGMRPPVVLTERVVIPTSSTLEVYEPNEGAFLKSVPLKVAARSNAVGFEDLVFIGGDDAGSGRVVALDINQPYVHTIWQLMIPKGGLASTPAVSEGVLFIGGGDGNVYAVSPKTREALWSLPDGVFKTEGPIVGDVAADDGGVYVASTDSRLYCLQPGTGRLRWQFYGGVALTQGPILTPTQLYLPIPNKGIAAFEKGEGAFNREPQWVAEGMTKFLADDEKFVYLLRGKDNVIVAFDKATGEQKFESNRRDLITFATNNKGDGIIFAASKTNRLLAIKPVLRPGVVGELVWNEVDAEEAVAMAH